MEPLLIMGALFVGAVAATIVAVFVVPALLLAGLASAVRRAPGV